MDLAEFESAIDQLSAAAQLIASEVPQEARMSALESLAFFRLLKARISEASPTDTSRTDHTSHTSDDELFKDTAMAALTMAGRKEFLAAALLLDQARSLLRDEISGSS
jgi:hypothetical protein